uniref:Non-structural polyprotein 1AB n=2 Tax=Porcine astrovirus 1 TaxID=1239567 RepID=A0A513Q841_PASV1|nr:MAG: ORF1ab [Mamastrovirus 3]
MVDQLRCLPGHRSNSPWDIRTLPRHMIYPTLTTDPRDRVIIASSVTVDNEWVTYVLDGDSWRQTICAPDEQAVILVCALLNDKEEKEKEIATLKMENDLKNQQCAYLRQQIPPKTSGAKWSWLSILALLVLILATLKGAMALETQSTSHAVDYDKIIKLNEELDEFITIALQKNWTKQVTEVSTGHYATNGLGWKEKILSSLNDWYESKKPQTTYLVDIVLLTVGLVTPWLWELSVLALSILIIIKSDRKVYDFFYLAAASFSQLRFSLIVLAPLQTVYTIYLTCVLAVVYYIDPIATSLISVVHLVVFSIVGMFLPDVDYIKNLRAVGSVTLIILAHWICDLFGISPLVITAVCFVWRLARLLIAMPGQVIEIRDASGKITQKISSLEGPLFKFFQGLKTKLKQVRSTTVPLIRINPAAVCHISTGDGSKGTGFFCANYVVTAAHVMGNHKVGTVCYQGKNYQANVKKTSEKDMIFLEIPSALQGVPRLKLSKKYNCDWVCVLAPSGEGAFITSVVEGKAHGDTFSYPCPTRDGMSGAPLLDVDGHVLGIHQTNTGYTGGAVRLEHEDVIDPPKENTQVAALKKQIEELKMQLAQKDAAPATPSPKPQRPPRTKDMKQCNMEDSDIVELIRIAMQREMGILREEINDSLLQKKKGKSKHGRGRKHGGGRRRKIGRMFTEEEYQEMLDSGLEPEQIRAIAEELYDQQHDFPEWSDPEDDEEVNEWWFGDDYSANVNNDDDDIPSYYQKKKKPLSDYLIKEWTKESIDEMLSSLSPLELKKAQPLLQHLKCDDPLKKTVIVAMLDRVLTSNGLSPVSDGLEYQQRMKPKNGKSGRHDPQKPTSVRGKKSAVKPRRHLVPDGYPVYCNLPVYRPICDYNISDEPLLCILPPAQSEFEYAPTVWGPEAFAKSFEKFDYAPYCDFEKEYPECTQFADWAWRVHHSYLEDTQVIHISATEKNLDSTPAYPKMLDYDTEEDFLDEHGWDPYVSAFSAIDRGYDPDVLWYCFLKKEILKKKKIEDSDIRQIVCADPIYARIGACFEQHQNHLTKLHTEEKSGQCGWSPFNGGFTRLCQRLESKPGVFVELDWTRFDGTIPAPLLKRIKKLRFSMLCTEHQERYQHIYKWYVKNLLNRYVMMPSGEVTKQTRGNPSGQISTTIDNNMVNIWLQAFEFCWFFGPDKELWRDYDTIVYGDDRLTRYPILPENYRERVIALYKDVFGMWIKPDKVKVSETLEGLTFCGFTVGPDRLPYPTDEEKLYAGLVTPARKLPDVTALHGKLLSLQLLMHNHPDSAFKDYINKCLAETARHAEDLPARLTERQMDRLWRGGPKHKPNG